MTRVRSWISIPIVGFAGVLLAIGIYIRFGIKRGNVVLTHLTKSFESIPKQ